MGDGIAEGFQFLIGGFQLQLGLLNRRLRLLSIGDVSRNPKRADNLASLIQEWYLRRGDPGPSAIGPNDPLFHIHQRSAGSYYFLLFFIRKLCMWKKVKIRLAYDLAGIIQPKRLGLGPAVPDKAALGILKINMIWHMVKQHLEQRIGLR